MKRLATLFACSIIGTSVSVQAATFTNTQSPYFFNSGNGDATTSDVEELPIGLYSSLSSPDNNDASESTPPKKVGTAQAILTPTKLTSGSSDGGADGTNDGNNVGGGNNSAPISFSSNTITITSGEYVISNDGNSLTVSNDVTIPNNFTVSNIVVSGTGVLTTGTAETPGGLALTNLTLKEGGTLKINLNLSDATKPDRIRISSQLILDESAKIVLNVDELSDHAIINLNELLFEDPNSENSGFFLLSDGAAKKIDDLDFLLSLIEIDGENSGDFILFANDASAFLANVNAVPEPSTLALLLLGSAGLYVAHRNRRRKK